MNISNFSRNEIEKFVGPLIRCSGRLISVQKKGSDRIETIDESQFNELFGVTYSGHLIFANEKSFHRTIKNCPWTLSRGSAGEENRRLAKTYQKELKEEWKADVAIKWIDPILGYGLFANQKIPLGTYIGEFTGHIRQLNRWHPQLNPYCFHYPTRFFSWNYTIIDALNAGNEMRFINHSDTPNLQPYCLCDRNLLHIVFFTKEIIPSGAQLTYNYGNDFWKHRQKAPCGRTSKKKIAIDDYKPNQV